MLEGYFALEDLTGTTSDALDQCAMTGTGPGSVLQPPDPEARIVGQVITVLNRRLEKPSKARSSMERCAISTIRGASASRRWR